MPEKKELLRMIDYSIKYSEEILKKRESLELKEFNLKMFAKTSDSEKIERDKDFFLYPKEEIPQCEEATVKDKEELFEKINLSLDHSFDAIKGIEVTLIKIYDKKGISSVYYYNQHLQEIRKNIEKWYNEPISENDLVRFTLVCDRIKKLNMLANKTLSESFSEDISFPTEFIPESADSEITTQSSLKEEELSSEYDSEEETLDEEHLITSSLETDENELLKIHNFLTTKYDKKILYYSRQISLDLIENETFSFFYKDAKNAEHLKDILEKLIIQVSKNISNTSENQVKIIKTNEITKYIVTILQKISELPKRENEEESKNLKAQIKILKDIVLASEKDIRKKTHIGLRACLGIISSQFSLNYF